MATMSTRRDLGFIGPLYLLLVAIILASLSVSGQVTDMASMNSSMMTTEVNSIATNMSGSAGPSADSVSITPQMTPTMSDAITTQSLTPSNGSSITQSATSFATGGSPTSMMYSSLPSDSTGFMNETSMTNSSTWNMIYCPSFMCNYSDCSAMYGSSNTSSCPADCFCQLLRCEDMRYEAKCSNSCADSCVSGSQTNCSVACCNTTGCLDGTFASMNSTTTTATIATQPMTQTTMAPTTTPKPTPKNGKKCHQGQCTGEKCYQTFQTFQTCSSSEPHCQLKKLSDKMQWTAGCTKNCSDETFCKASVNPPCLLECCNATSWSCLWLNGTLNTPSAATRGPLPMAELVAVLLCLLAFTLLQ